MAALAAQADARTSNSCLTQDKLPLLAAAAESAGPRDRILPPPHWDVGYLAANGAIEAARLLSRRLQHMQGCLLVGGTARAMHTCFIGPGDLKGVVASALPALALACSLQAAGHLSAGKHVQLL